MWKFRAHIAAAAAFVAVYSLGQAALHGLAGSGDFTLAAWLRWTLLESLTMTGWALSAAALVLVSDRFPLQASYDRAMHLAVHGLVTGMVLVAIPFARGGWAAVLDDFGLRLLFVVAVYAAYRLTRLAAEARDLQRKTSTHRLEMHRMAYAEMAVRVQPALLLRTLRRIEVVAADNPRAADRALALFGEFLRHVLRSLDGKPTTLAAETDLIGRYTTLMRFWNEDIRLHVDVEPGTESVLLPPGAFWLGFVERVSDTAEQAGQTVEGIRLETRKEGNRVRCGIRVDGIRLGNADLEALRSEFALHEMDEVMRRTVGARIGVRMVQAGDRSVRLESVVPVRTEGAA